LHDARHNARDGYTLGMPTRSARGKLLRLAALAPASVLCGCSGGGGSPATDGPLSGGPYGSPTMGGTVCAPAGVGQPWTFGIDEFTNHGPASVVMDRAVLLHSRHERLITALAVPGTVLFGVVHWPPHFAGMQPAWKHRQPLAGFRLAHGMSFVLVLELTPTADGLATERGIAVYYHDPSGTYVASSQFGLQFEVSKSGAATCLSAPGPQP